VEFWDLGPEGVFVSAVGHIDDSEERELVEAALANDSLVDAYRSLAGAEPHALDTLAALDERIARAAAAAPPADAPEQSEEIEWVEKSHAAWTAPAGWSWAADDTWFVQTFCAPEPGVRMCVASRSQASLKGSNPRRRVTTAVNQAFAEHGTAIMSVSRNPCDNAPFWDFCTKGPVIYFSVAAEPRHIYTHRLYNNPYQVTSSIQGARVALMVATL
jgi:hypothetical protein